jgi:hypothetical protein
MIELKEKNTYRNKDRKTGRCHIVFHQGQLTVALGKQEKRNNYLKTRRTLRV